MRLEPFGEQLLITGDLDPVYFVTALVPEAKLPQWLIAYWVFYDVGTAFNVIGRPESFKHSLLLSDTHHDRRGSERRHMRGSNFRKAVDSLDAYGCDKLFSDLCKCRSLHDVKVITKGLSGFGPWITFKMADMLERCVSIPIEFDLDALDFYASPREAAQMYAPTMTVLEVVCELIERFKGFVAPPKSDRAVGIQEVETILCKWGSHAHGYYSVGKDTKEVYHALERYPNIQHAWVEELHKYSGQRVALH